MAPFQTLLSLATLVVLVLLLYKTIKVHHLTFRIDSIIRDQHALKAETHQLRKGLSDLYTQLEALVNLRDIISPKEPLPPLRGWAASPDFLLELAKHTLKHKPETIVECSSGASTVVLARCCQLNGLGHVFSLEHDPTYATKTRDLIEGQGLRDWATVIVAPLSRYADHPDIPWYDIRELPLGEGACALLVVDGPPGGDVKRARYPALPLLMPFLAKNCSVFLDDASRPDEQSIVAEWISKYPQFSVTNLACEKGCTKLTRGD